jgi:hypothetical protein
MSASLPNDYVKNINLTNISISITSEEAAIVENASIDAMDVNISEESENATSSNISGPTQIENCGSIQNTWPPTDYVLLPPGSQASEAYHVAVIGDSIAWGNGLCRENKYYYLVADWLRKVRNQPVEVKVYAHSGATISGISGPNCQTDNPALNSGCPTLTEQINSIQNSADVDLVLVSGGANDVGVLTVLDLEIPADELRNRCESMEGSMSTLLGSLLTKCNNAKIIVIGYYPAISEESNVDLLRNEYKKIMDKDLPNNLDDSEIKRRFIENSQAFDIGFDAGLKKAVTNCNSDRVAFADINFMPNNCYGASEKWLWFLDYSLNPPYWAKTDDELFDYRNSLITEDDSDNRFNAMGHPNRDGAKEYARTIEGSTVTLLNLPTVALQAAANNKYVCAENGGNLPLIANRGAIGSWETFDLIDLGNNNVALLAVNGKFVCAENGGNLPLIANRGAIDSWETFDLIDLGNNNVALRAHANNKFVCADNAGQLPLIANRNSYAQWETFKLIYLSNRAPTTPSIPSYGPTTGTVGTSYSYSTSATDPDGDQVKYTFDWGDETTSVTNLVNSDETGSASHSWNVAGTYQVKSRATDSKGASSGWSNALSVSITTGTSNAIALQAANSQFVCAEGGGGGAVVANRNAIGAWETFKLFDRGNGNVALQAANSQFVCAEGGGGGAVVANRNAIGAWETFKLITDPCKATSHTHTLCPRWKC